MKKNRIFLLLCLLLTLLACSTLTRCGSGIGPAYDADVNGMKY